MSTPLPPPLAAVEAWAERVRVDQEALAAAVAAARARGITWTDVAKALGVTRQAATQRYGR